MQAQQIRIGLVTDVHWAVDPSPAGWHNPYDFAGTERRLEEAGAHFREAGVDMVVVGGDVSHHGDATSIRAAVQVCATNAPAPVVVVAGNHDVAIDPDRPGLAVAELDRGRVALLGSEGVVHAGVRVAGVGIAPGEGWFGFRMGNAPSIASLGEGVAVVVSHFPLLSRASFLAEHGWAYPGDLIDRQGLVDQLAGRAAPTLVLSGHIHARNSHAMGPVLQFTQGALIEPPYDCAIVDVARDPTGAVTVQRRSHRLAGTRAAREPVFADPFESWRYGGAGWTRAQPDAAPDGGGAA